MKFPLPPAIVIGEQPPLNLHHWVHPATQHLPRLLACARPHLLDCSLTHSPLHGKGSEGISARCAHA